MEIVKKHGMFKTAGSQDPTLVVLHHTVGSSLSGSERTLQERGLGYHFMIDKAGIVYEYVDPRTVTFHAAGHNHGTVGISFVCGGPGGPVNDVQYTSCVELLKMLKSHTSVTTLTGHKHIAKNGKIDPTWPGEPLDGVDYKVDVHYMERLKADTGLDLYLRK